jgi:polysaccharide export outer membrane protein
MRITVFMILIALSGALLSGCSASSTPLTAVGSITPNAPGGPAPLGSGMHLQAGDKVRVTVFGEDKISGEYEIDLDGFLSLPLAGTLKAAGQSKMELEGIIATKLKSNYLKDPKVTVDVVTFRPIYVLGEVQKPGEYPFRSGLNVMSALAVAGGSTYRASNSRVMIQRFGESALKEYALDAAVPILPGDVIRLPERYF